MELGQVVDEDEDGGGERERETHRERQRETENVKGGGGERQDDKEEECKIDFAFDNREGVWCACFAVSFKVFLLLVLIDKKPV